MWKLEPTRATPEFTAPVAAPASNSSAAWDEHLLWRSGHLVPTDRQNSNRATRFADVRSDTAADESAIKRVIEAVSASTTTSWQKKVNSAGWDYAAFCAQSRIIAEPISFHGMRRYLDWRVNTAKLEPGGIPGWRSAHRRYCLERNISSTISEQQEKFIGAATDGWIKTCKGQNARGQRSMLRFRIIIRILATSNGSPEDLQFEAQLSAAYWAMMRTAEHTAGRQAGCE